MTQIIGYTISPPKKIKEEINLERTQTLAHLENTYLNLQAPLSEEDVPIYLVGFFFTIVYPRIAWIKAFKKVEEASN